MDPSTEVANIVGLREGHTDNLLYVRPLGPFSIVTPTEATPKSFYIVKYHHHPTPNSPPQKVEIIVPKEYL